MVANPGFLEQERGIKIVSFNKMLDSNIQSQFQSQQNANSNRENESSPLADSIADLELLSNLIRTLSITLKIPLYIEGETTFNRRNLRRRLLQQRTNGFNMDVNESLEIIHQNTLNLDTMLKHITKPNEVSHFDNSEF